jgi:hypothetical protein
MALVPSLQLMGPRFVGTASAAAILVLQRRTGAGAVPRRIIGVARPSKVVRLAFR